MNVGRIELPWGRANTILTESVHTEGPLPTVYIVAAAIQPRGKEQHGQTTKLSDWLIVAATLLGPVLAVQAQKWVERAREGNVRRVWVFTTLMATRQARLSVDHVRALNSIDLAFYGRRILGHVIRRPRAQAVLDAWHDYYKHLNLPEDRRPKTDAEQLAWTGRGDELFTNLLDRLATATNFKFDRDQLQAGSYSPEAHNFVENEQNQLRRLTLELVSGKRSLPMEVKSFPVDEEAVALQKESQRQLVRNQEVLLERLADILGRLADQRALKVEERT